MSDAQIKLLLSNYIPIFDLDNTIYPEIEYIGPIYLHTLSKFIDIKDNNSYLNKFKSFYEINGNKDLIDGLIFDQSINKSDFIKQYKINLRGRYLFEKKIKCYPEFIKYIKSNIYNNLELIILTNGNSDQQKHKLNSLDLGFLENLNIKLIVAEGRLAKPNAEIFYKNIYQPDCNYVFIGDSKTDKEFSDNAKVPFINVKDFKAWCNRYIR